MAKWFRARIDQGFERMPLRTIFFLEWVFFEAFPGDLTLLDPLVLLLAFSISTVFLPVLSAASFFAGFSLPAFFSNFS